MIDCSIRTLRLSTGYTVPSQESSSHALYAAQRLINEEKLVLKRKSRGEIDETTTSISKTNAASDQKKNNKGRQVRNSKYWQKDDKK